MNVTERQKLADEYNAALARRDTGEVERISNLLLNDIHERQLADWNVKQRTGASS